MGKQVPRIGQVQGNAWKLLHSHRPQSFGMMGQYTTNAVHIFHQKTKSNGTLIVDTNGSCSMTAKRIQKLETIDVQWTIKKPQVVWDFEMLFEKLVQFYQEHGHSIVPKDWHKD